MKNRIDRTQELQTVFSTENPNIALQMTCDAWYSSPPAPFSLTLLFFSFFFRRFRIFTAPPLFVAVKRTPSFIHC